MYLQFKTPNIFLISEKKNANDENSKNRINLICLINE